eukprot:TRINITY_DN3278_c0_g1_i2.p1 TRINITY_DN3278_c0_g1~~TRINITY_DN3278_c0_g1_i2.p1  ORF type:complete len:120 (+),score=38.90 TRINITY_DN3278_c0_g1_i2:237-596(+)
MSLCDGKARKVRKAIGLKLAEVKDIFEVHEFGFLIVDIASAAGGASTSSSSSSSDPHVIYPVEKGKRDPQQAELLDVLLRLRNVVASFGEMLEESTFPVFHITGDRNRFSCYAVGKLVR